MGEVSADAKVKLFHSLRWMRRAYTHRQNGSPEPPSAEGGGCVADGGSVNKQTIRWEQAPTLRASLGAREGDHGVVEGL